MMNMDCTPLNKAHQLERKAEKLNHLRKYDECMDCHKEIVNLFNECLTIGDNKIVRESIKLQKEWNERQIRMLQIKKAYVEKKDREKKQKSVASSKISQKSPEENLQDKIFKTIETHDSLIYYLGQRGIIDPNEKKSPNSDESDDKVKDPPTIIGSKHPKDNTTVIEELKVLSGQLKESVQGLLIQLDDRNKEIEQLRAQIKDLELEKTSKEDDFKDNLKVIDFSGGTSPFVFSPITELGPEIPELPLLEPLDLPPLDISKFKDFHVPDVSSRLFRSDK